MPYLPHFLRHPPPPPRPALCLHPLFGSPGQPDSPNFEKFVQFETLTPGDGTTFPSRGDEVEVCRGTRKGPLDPSPLTRGEGCWWY